VPGFTNPSFADIAALLDRARALQEFGYRIIPVTPSAPEVLGEPAVADLDQLRARLDQTGPVDIVDEAAALQARAAGIFTVMNRCLFRDRASLGRQR
jgi:predicted CoA-binding protein